MPLRTVCCYGHLTGPNGWGDEQNSVNQLVDAIKGEPVKGYGFVSVGAGPKRRIDQSNADDAVEWFGEMAAEFLQLETFTTSPLLIPFPDSKSIRTTLVSRTRRLADAIARRYAATVLDTLRFDRAMPSSHSEGGSRDPQTIYPRLCLIRSIPFGTPCVLVDDVVTTGGHLRAAATFLRRIGPVPLAICVASASQIPVDSPFQRITRELEDFSPKSIGPVLR